MEKKSSIHKDRLIEYLEYKGIRKTRFYQDTGVSNGLLDKESGLTLRIVEKIISVYTDLSASWLISGRGDMLIEESDPKGIQINGDVAHNHQVNIGQNESRCGATEQYREAFAVIQLLEKQLADKDEYIRFLSARLTEANSAIQTLAGKISPVSINQSDIYREINHK